MYWLNYLFFTYSKTFYCAIAARFGWGIISSCYNIVIPTYLTEVIIVINYSVLLLTTKHLVVQILDGKEQRVQGFTMYGISLGLAPIFVRVNILFILIAYRCFLLLKFFCCIIILKFCRVLLLVDC